MKTITFCYIVGGDDRHYRNLYKSLMSLNDRIKTSYEILILNNSKKPVKYPTNIKTKVLEINLEFPQKLQWFWSTRYRINKYISTEYGYYLDTDMVFVNDRIQELIERSDDKFYICKHWWVKSYGDYLTKGKPPHQVRKQFKTKEDLPYFASGSFLFNVDKNKSIFEKYWDNFDLCYSYGDDYKQGVTDEFILCHTLNSKNDSYKFANGSMNHTSEFGTMPLEFKDGTIWGKNPVNDEKMEKIVALHCDTHRRDPSNKYPIEAKEYIKEMFYL